MATWRWGTQSLEPDRYCSTEIPAAIDHRGRERLDKSGQGLVGANAHPGAEETQSAAHHAGVPALVATDQQVHDLVDQADGVDLGGGNEPAADGVNTLGKAAGGAEVREDQAAEARVGGEEAFVELISIAGPAGDVKFENDCHGPIIYQKV